MRKFDHEEQGGRVALGKRLTDEERETKKRRDALAEMQEFLEKNYGFKPQHKLK